MAHDGGRTFPRDVPESRAGSPHRAGALRMGPHPRAATRLLARTLAAIGAGRAEKLLSHKHRYLWICVPNVASRSLIATLRAVDPGAELIRIRTLKLMKC